MDVNLKILIIYCIFSCLLSFYQAYRVQLYRGVELNSKTEAVVTYVFYVLQMSIPALYLFKESFPYVAIAIICIPLVIKLLNIYANGQVIVIYETSKDILMERIRSELNRLNINYKEEGNRLSDLHQFFLEDESIIKINSPWGGDKEYKTFHLNFIKWWRFYHYEEIKNYIIDIYREERENKIFWKQISTSVGLGLILISFLIFAQWKYSPFQ